MMRAPAKLTLGPLLFHWDAEKRRDFYYRVADEALVDGVYLGEVVCSKRAAFFEDYRDSVIDRLRRAGKEVILSSLALVTLPREVEALKRDCESGFLIEANDVSALQTLGDRPFVVGPFLNVLNEGTFDALAARGAKRIVFASELNGLALSLLAAHRPEIEKEVQVFGRQPLAVSMRCYSARSAGRDKDHCRLACAPYPDGLETTTIDGQPVLTVNGTQTLSHGYLVLADEARALHGHGVTHFRLSPQDMDMVAVAKAYRNFMDEKIEAENLRESLLALKPDMTFINGFYHGREGMAHVYSASSAK